MGVRVPKAHWVLEQRFDGHKQPQVILTGLHLKQLIKCVQVDSLKISSIGFKALSFMMRTD